MKIYLYILLFFAANTAFAQQSARAEAINLLQLGNNALNLGKMRDAEDYYDRAIAIDQEFAMAYMLRSALFQKLGKESEASADYNQAISMNPYSVYTIDKSARLEMVIQDIKGGVYYLNEIAENTKLSNTLIDHDPFIDLSINEYEQAIFNINDLNLALPDSMVRYLLTGLKRLRSKEYERALTDIKIVTDAYPASVIANDILGIAYLKMNRYADADAAFNKALLSNKEYKLSFYNRGILRKVQQNNINGAIDDLNQALKIDPDFAAAYYYRGTLERIIDKNEAALKDYSRAIDLDNGLYAAYADRGVLNVILSDYNGALWDLDRAIEVKNVENPYLYNLRGNIKILQQEYRSAIEDYTEALRLDPDYATAYFNKGMAQIMLFAYRVGCENLHESLDLGILIAADRIKYFCAEY